MLLVGEMNTTKQITVTLAILDDSGLSQDVQCMINTGFMGHLTLPTSAIEVLGLEYVTDADLVLAGVPTRRARQFAASIEWLGNQIILPILELESRPLVGMRLLYGCDLHAHLLDGGFVTLAAL